jgi:hypothetical protein
MSSRSWTAWVLFVAFVLATAVPAPAVAQDQIGGHFGVIIPLVTRANDTTTTVSDDFLIGFPTGITISTGARVAFDLELVSVVQNEPLHVDLTVHPGVIIGLSDRLNAGLRMAFDVGRPSWGFTPLVNRSFSLNGNMSVFGELVIPIRFQIDPSGSHFTSVGLGIHTGIAF